MITILLIWYDMIYPHPWFYPQLQVTGFSKRGAYFTSKYPEWNRRNQFFGNALIYSIRLIFCNQMSNRLCCNLAFIKLKYNQLNCRRHVWQSTIYQLSYIVDYRYKRGQTCIWLYFKLIKARMQYNRFEIDKLEHELNSIFAYMVFVIDICYQNVLTNK